jgi:LysM repeat protein
MKLLIAGILLAGLTACNPPAAQPSEIKPDTGLTAWYTTTVTPSVTATREDLPTLTLVPTLTPTPSEYTVRANDTLIVIAYRKGLTVDQLLAANPNVNAYALSIGTVLKIPAARPGSGTPMAATPTPAPLLLDAPECVPALTGGLHCFVMARNEGDTALENVLVEFRMTAKDNSLTASRNALLPLQVLQADENLPIYAYFEPPIPLDQVVVVQLLSAYRVSSAGSNSFRLEVAEPKVEIAPEGYSARVTGNVISAKSDPVGKNIRIVVVAYDAAGNVVGIRQYQETAELISGTEFKYNLIVYSVGQPISSVQVFAEAAQ